MVHSMGNGAQSEPSIALRLATTAWVILLGLICADQAFYVVHIHVLSPASDEPATLAVVASLIFSLAYGSALAGWGWAIVSADEFMKGWSLKIAGITFAAGVLSMALAAHFLTMSWIHFSSLPDVGVWVVVGVLGFFLMIFGPLGPVFRYKRNLVLQSVPKQPAA